VTEDELAAIIAAVQALQQETTQAPEPQMSAWKRTARAEAVSDVR
jgi:hypothetical protein